jgi:hypothetical protein
LEESLAMHTHDDVIDPFDCNLGLSAEHMLKGLNM